MRRLLFLAPLLLVGCRASRQAAVSSDGRVASTVEGGTFVAGRGKVAEGGSSLAWSPDGQTLAVATDEGALLWPKGERVAGLQGPLAWSPDGSALAGTRNGHTEVSNLGTGGSRDPDLRFVNEPDALRWTPDGRVFGHQGGLIRLEGGASLDRKTARIQDAVAIPGGEIAWIETDYKEAKSISAALASPVRVGRWNPADGAASASTRGMVGSLLGPASSRRLSFPLHLALAPDGVRFAAGGFVLEAGARTVARLKDLIDKKGPSKAEDAEMDRILKTARTRAVVVRFDGTGPGTTVWSAPVQMVMGEERGIEDLEWSPDGRWLAIARKDGTVRVAMGE